MLNDYISRIELNEMPHLSSKLKRRKTLPFDQFKRVSSHERTAVGLNVMKVDVLCVNILINERTSYAQE
jgi:hypothetical protein